MVVPEESDGVAKALRKYGQDQAKILRVGYPRNTLEVDDAKTKARRMTMRAGQG